MPPPPKEPSLRARRNKTTTRAVLTARKGAKVPPLPKGTRWYPEVRAWWTRTWKSEMTGEWADSDTDGMYLALKLMQAFWDPDTSPNVCRALAGEIRQLLAQYGLTPMARRSLQWEIDRGEAAAETTAQRRAGKAAPAKKAPAKPDPRVTRANLRVV